MVCADETRILGFERACRLASDEPSACCDTFHSLGNFFFMEKINGLEVKKIYCPVAFVSYVVMVCCVHFFSLMFFYIFYELVIGTNVVGLLKWV